MPMLNSLSLSWRRVCAAGYGALLATALVGVVTADPSQDPDDVLEKAEKEMQARQPMLNKLLLERKIGEKLDGFLAPLPKVNLEPPEMQLLVSENASRTQIYDAQGEITGKSPLD